MAALVLGAADRRKTGNGLNWGSFSDPAVDKLGEESLAEFDVAKRNVLIGRMHEKLVADAYEAFIVHDLNPRALSPQLTGFVQAQSWFQDMTSIVVHRWTMIV